MLLLIGGMGFSSCSNYDDYEEDVNYAAQVAGEYYGTAILKYYGSEYMVDNDMKIVVTRSSNNYAMLEVRYTDDTVIFEEESFEVIKDGSSYTLVNVNRSDETAVVDRNGKMEYEIPSFSVQGEGGYSMEFYGSKE